jgi:DNA-binding response OmpR family regulator
MARVLIVEDSFVVAQMIEGIVAELGHDAVGAAPNAAAALDMARRLKPDLVILDLQLSEGDVGEELAKALVAETSASILICSAFADWVLRHVEQRVRPCATVRKPVDLDELRAAIEHCLADGQGDDDDGAPGGGRGRREALDDSSAAPYAI